MIIQVTIPKDGKNIVTEVVDRQQHACSEVYRVTNNLGRQLSDESLPDAPREVFEGTGQSLPRPTRVG